MPRLPTSADSRRWEETHDGELPEHDGRERFYGEDGEVYIADGSGLENVDEVGAGRWSVAVQRQCAMCCTVAREGQ